ncbi:MAG: amino acid permease [Acidobacteria bacterium]|nr:amino acid permease [Acidobacteriota bacterium]
MGGALLRTKSLQKIMAQTEEEGHKLKKSLRAWDLVAIGIGCSVGVGIFVLPGVEAAKHSGPGIILAFALTAVTCACSALSYAELASMLPVSGSAYTYGYATLGEIFAWIIGWDLVLEYMVGACLVSIGWSAYFTNMVNHLLKNSGFAIPAFLTASPLVEEGPGWINLPAMLIVAVIAWLLIRGIKESARVNLAIVIVKVAVIGVFVCAAAGYVDAKNWDPFLPFGFSGVMTSAAIVFLAYVGFDAVSTTAEEAVNPRRDMPIGIIGSLVVTTLLYMATSAVMTGVVHYPELGVADPLNKVLDVLKMPWVQGLVSVGAIAGITSVLLVLLMGQPRILFAMSRDGLLPRAWSNVHRKYRTPHVTTLVTALVVAVGAGLLPIEDVAELCSIGTLFAFVIVCAGVVVLRFTRKDLHRPFRVPGGWTCAVVLWLVMAGFVLLIGHFLSLGRPGFYECFFLMTPAGKAIVLGGAAVVFVLLRQFILQIIGIAMCVYLMLSLPWLTWARFGVWLAIGLLIYFFYSRTHSLAATEETAKEAGEEA